MRETCLEIELEEERSDLLNEARRPVRLQLNIILALTSITFQSTFSRSFRLATYSFPLLRNRRMANPDPAATSTSPYVPRPESIAFLYSLPLPPGVTSQPQPRTQQDWALVEQYRLLCQSLTVLGDYERARRKEGLQPVDWKDLNIPHRKLYLVYSSRDLL